MYPDLSLKENVIHGTPQNPIHAMHFTAGKGTAYPDHFFVERHWHRDVELLFITKGEYLFEINLEEHLLKAGDLCILNSEELHMITGKGSGTVHEVLLFDPRILDFSYPDEWEETCISPFLNKSLVFPNILHPSDSGYSHIRTIFQKLMEEAGKSDPGWYIRCKLLLLEFFSLMTAQQLFLPAKEVLSASDARKINRYKTIISYIENHYEEPISLQQLADLISCNSQYLCRFFRELAGVTPIQYLISYRLEQAGLLLTHTGQPITDISLSCGFDNISYFIRKFKAAKGCTPTEYRKRCGSMHDC